MEAGAMDALLGHVRLTGVCWLERIIAMTYKPFKSRGIKMMVMAGKGLTPPLASCRSGLYPRCMCLPRALVQEVMGGQLLWISQSLCVY